MYNQPGNEGESDTPPPKYQHVVIPGNRDRNESYLTLALEAALIGKSINLELANCDDVPISNIVSQSILSIQVNFNTNCSCWKVEVFPLNVRP